MGQQLQWYKKYSAVDSEAKCNIRRPSAHTFGLINTADKAIPDFQMKLFGLLPLSFCIYLQDAFCLPSHLITTND